MTWLRLDECKDSNGGCDHDCSYVNNTVTCSCREGFNLTEDGKTCKGLFSEFYTRRMRANRVELGQVFNPEPDDGMWTRFKIDVGQKSIESLHCYLGFRTLKF